MVALRLVGPLEQGPLWLPGAVRASKMAALALASGCVAGLLESQTDSTLTRSQFGPLDRNSPLRCTMDFESEGNLMES